MKTRTFAWAVLLGSSYSVWRALRHRPAILHPSIQSRLPLAKNLPTIPDFHGNYDIDGVSFDTSGVVVSGDGNKAHQIASDSRHAVDPSEMADLH